MATLSIQIASGSGTNTTTLTFSSADAQRIFAAWQNKIQPSGTQAQMVQWFSLRAQDLIADMIAKNETVAPIVPSIASSNS